MNLNQITIPSKNVNKAIDFYSLLGLKLIVHTHDKYARFECPNGESTFSIHYVEEFDTTGIAIYFEVPKLTEKVKELQSKGVVFETEIIHQSWLWTEARLKDPDNNTLIIYHAGKNRKYPPWRKED